MIAKKIYLAGPDVFYPDVHARLQSVAAACAGAGLLAIKPVEDELLQAGAPQGKKSPKELGLAIFQDNIRKLNECDAVLANLESFRGGEPDSGTVFEVGYAIAMGKPVVGYFPGVNISMKERIAKVMGLRSRPDGSEEDRLFGMLVEDFEFPLNLMIAGSVTLCVSYEEGALLLKSILEKDA